MTSYQFKPGQPTWKPSYPGFPTQAYRIGDHLYSTGGSEAQKAPNRSTYCKHPYQWQIEHFGQVAESQRNQAQGATDRAASRATIVATDNAADKLNTLSTVKIGERIDATDALNNELKKTLDDVDMELKLMDDCMAETQATIDSKKEPLDALNQYIALRGTRMKSEKLCDEEMASLLRMQATLNESIRLLESALGAQQNEKMRLLVKKAALEADIADKTTASAIDTQAKAITMSNRPITAPGFAGSAGASLRGFGGGSLNQSLLYAPYDPVQWRMSSKQTIEEARRIMQVCERLREKSAQLQLDRQAEEASVYSDLFANWQLSMARIAEVMARTEGQIELCKGESNAIVGQVDAVGTSYGLKQEGLGVVVDRLATRSTRPMRELVQDPAQRALANELSNLKIHSRVLQASADKLGQDHNNLAKMIDNLEETMALTQHTMDIQTQGEPIMAILKKNAERLGASSFRSPASLTPGELSNVFRFPDKRVVTTALPANRLSLSRSYASR